MKKYFLQHLDFLLGTHKGSYMSVPCAPQCFLALTSVLRARQDRFGVRDVPVGCSPAAYDAHPGSLGVCEAVRNCAVVKVVRRAPVAIICRHVDGARGFQTHGCMVVAHEVLQVETATQRLAVDAPSVTRAKGASLDIELCLVPC